MILKKLLETGCEILSSYAESARFEAECLLSEVLKKDRIFLTVHSQQEVAPEAEKIFIDFCKRRALGEPFAYIAGQKEFMSLEFKVDTRVLIPRPETELLVENIIEKHQNFSPAILDICTGSGAIACSLAYYIKNSKVSAIDISDGALEIARENAQKILGNKKIEFFKKNALEKIVLNEKFDLVVSNPPYIESETIETLQKDVKNFEPQLALDGGNDGLIFYREIVHNIESVLKPKGELYFEIGFNQGSAVKSIMEQKFSDIKVIKDYSGNDRIVHGQLA